MIRITPYYARPNANLIQQEYLRMIAAVTPFLAEDILFDDPTGLKLCTRTPKRRKQTKNGNEIDTEFAKLLKDKGITDGNDKPGQLRAEAELAEVIIDEYSEKMHHFLYEGSVNKGRVNQDNLRKLLLLKLPHGQIPCLFRFDILRSGPESEWKNRAKALYEYVFRYDEFSRLKSSYSHCCTHEFVGMLDVKVCPYCNRLFTTTVNTKEHRVRPQIDHFKDKNHFPFLALSLNNFVPACGVCNLLKLDKGNDLIYPYDEDFDTEEYVFSSTIPIDHIVPALEGIPISEKDFEVKLDQQNPNEPQKDSNRRDRIKNSIEAFSLPELYQSHRDYVAFLYRQRYILTKQLAQDLYVQFPELFSSVDEVESIFVLMYTDYKHWGYRPLAKLTHDILVEIDDLYTKNHILA